VAAVMSDCMGTFDVAVAQLRDRLDETALR
jgi:hypothetical protein